VIWINFTTPTKWLMDFSTDLDRVVVNYYYTHHAFKRHVERDAMIGHPWIQEHERSTLPKI
jgi:hypothetical protein